MTRRAVLPLLLLVALVCAQELPERPGGLDLTDATAVRSKMAEVAKRRDALAQDAPDASEWTAVFNQQITVLERHFEFLEAAENDRAAAAAATAGTAAEAVQQRARAERALLGDVRGDARRRLSAVTELDELRDRVRREFEAVLEEAKSASARTQAAYEERAAELAVSPQALAREEAALAKSLDALARLRETETDTDLDSGRRNLLRLRIEVHQQEAVAHEQRIRHLKEHGRALPPLVDELKLRAEAAELALRLARARFAEAQEVLNERLASAGRAAEEAVRRKEQELAAASAPHLVLRLGEELANEKLRVEVGALEHRAVEIAEQPRRLRETLDLAAKEYARYARLYRAEGSSEPRPASAVVADELRRLERATDRVAYNTDRDRWQAQQLEWADTLSAVQDVRRGMAASLSRAREEARATCPAREWFTEAVSWRALETGRAALLAKKEALLAEMVRDAGAAYELRGRAQEATRRTLVLLRRENLLLRGESRITWTAIRAGGADLARLPGYLLDAARGTGAYVTDAHHRGAVLGFGSIGVLAVVLVLFLTLRTARRARELEATPREGLRARAGYWAMRFLQVVPGPLCVFALPWVAATMLPGLPEGVRGLLRDLGTEVGGLWFGWRVTRTFVYPGTLLRIPVDAARQLATFLLSVLAVSAFFLPLESAMVHLGYRNEGVLELFSLAYEVLVGILVVSIARKRSLLLELIPARETPLGRFVGLLCLLLQPVLLLLVPALLVLQALRYDILVGLITGVSVVALSASTVGYLGYRAAAALVAGWLAGDADDELPGEEQARLNATRQVSRFILQVTFLLLTASAMLTLSGASLDEVRSFFEAALPFQSPDAARTVTWWNVLAAIVLLVFFFALTRAAKLALHDIILPRSKLDPGIRYTITTLFGYLLLGIGFYVALRELFDLSNLGYIVAALSVGIGFGLQELVANFVSGLTLLIERPLKVGDLVQVGDTEGIVQKINIRATTVLTRQNVYILVPNKEFITRNVVNYTHTDSKVRLHVALGVSYGSDVSRVREILLESVVTHGRVLRRPAPEVWFKGFGDSSLDFEVLAWVSRPEDRHPIASDLYFIFWNALKRGGIEIPFPQRDLHLRSAEPIRLVREGDETPPAAPEAEPHEG